jgi:aminopeptidase N
VGCVTYNEAYLFRDRATDNEHLDRAETFLHELAHMWFGNLVTMRWWDDLWLNESFATYISYLAMTEATRFTNAWKVFNGDIKRWAYMQDQLPTTHPISGRAADTEIAFLIFDGITYGKGASVLKQLVKYIGRDNFNEGLRLYFRRHAWGNATLAEFLRCLEEAGNVSLTDWAQKWLQTASVNTLSARWQAADGQIRSFTMDQTASEQFPTLRPHALEIGFGKEVGGRLQMTASVPASIDGPRTNIDAIVGLPEPDLVFPNYGDHAYAKVALDESSVDYVRGGLDRVDDDFLRNLLWASLWEMVRDAQLKSTDYLAICRSQLPTENDQDIVSVALERVAMALLRFVSESKRLDEAHAWFEVALDALAAATNPDAQISWARSAIRAAMSAEDAARLVRIVDGAESVGGFELDQEMRWSVSVKAVAFGLPEGDRLLEEQSAKDPSDRGHRALLQAEAARPTAEAKERAWERINGPGYGSFHLTRAAMSGFLWAHQTDILAPYVDRFFGHVRDIFEDRDHPFARAYIQLLYPTYRADTDVLERSRSVLAGLNGSLPTLTRQLTEHADELERVIRVRAFAEEA